MTDQHEWRTSARIDYLESIRGLAAIQVLLLHAFAAFAPGLVFSSSSSPTWMAYVHLSPLYFLYDGYSAVYIFFVLSGYVLSRSFERQLAQPFSIVAARIVRLGLPAIAATIVAASVLVIYGRPNAEVGKLVASDWFAQQWNPDLSIGSIIKDGLVNALFLGYRGLPGVTFLSPWQQPVDQSFVAPLWTLSIEFYGSMVVLALCMVARRSRAWWWVAVTVGLIFTIRSAYVCFFVGHLVANFHGRHHRDDETTRNLWPAYSIAFGILLCVAAEVWQPAWLQRFCSDPTPLFFPGQFAPLQQKTFGAILVLLGLINLRAAQSCLSHPTLVRWSGLSFPVYLIHWPILFGPSAALFIVLQGVLGLEWAAACSIFVAVGLSILAGILFLPVDRGALYLSRELRRRISFVPTDPAPYIESAAMKRSLLPK